jgi:hypothetical protein
MLNPGYYDPSGSAPTPAERDAALRDALAEDAQEDAALREQEPRPGDRTCTADWTSPIDCVTNPGGRHVCDDDEVGHRRDHVCTCGSYAPQKSATPPADDWQDDPDVLSWDWREQPNMDALGRLLARHGVTVTQLETGTDDYAIRITAEPVAVLEDRLCRRIWAAALRHAPNLLRLGENHPARLSLLGLADQIGAGTLTPWATCDTCSGTGWVAQEGQIGVPGSARTHGCPDCDTGRARLAAGQLRGDGDAPVAPADWQVVAAAVGMVSPEPSTPPAQRPATAPVGPDVATDTVGTVQAGTGVLGRAWTEDGDVTGAVWYAEPLREVLLVDPAVGDVLAAASEVVAAGRLVAQLRTLDALARSERLFAGVRTLAAAVDALGDQPAEPAPEPATVGGPDHDGLTGQPIPAVCVLTEDDDMEAFAQLPDCPACEGTGKDLPPDWRDGTEVEPAPEPASGTGWDRDDVAAIIEGWNLRGVSDGSQETLTNLLADRDRMRDERRTLAMRCVEMERQRREDRAFLDTLADERDAARAELAEVTHRLERTRERVSIALDAGADVLVDTEDAWAARLATATADLATVRAELAEVTADRESAYGRLRHTQVERREASAQVARLEEELVAVRGQCDRVREHLKETAEDRDEAQDKVEGFPERLATARRDAAADALDYGARWIRRVFADGIDPEVAKCLDALAVTTRNGTRTIQPEPASAEATADRDRKREHISKLAKDATGLNHARQFAEAGRNAAGIRLAEVSIELEQSRADVARLEQELVAVRGGSDRLREHSVTLNSIGWKMATALGDVLEGAEQVRGNPVEQADRLIAERDEAWRLLAERGRLDELREDLVAQIRRDAVAGALEPVGAVCDAAEWQATRWADPLSVPEWVGQVRAAMAGQIPEEVASKLRHRENAEVRDGTRSVKPEPASGEAAS